MDLFLYVEKAIASGAVGDYFGFAVALSDDTARVGAPGDDVGAAINQGSAYSCDIGLLHGVFLPLVLRNAP